MRYPPIRDATHTGERTITPQAICTKASVGFQHGRYRGVRSSVSEESLVIQCVFKQQSPLVEPSEI